MNEYSSGLASLGWELDVVNEVMSNVAVKVT